MNNNNNAFSKYINEIGDANILSVEEEAILAQKIKQGDQRALDKLTRACLKFVVSLANQYKGRGADIGDLIGEGNMALIKAATKFEPNRGCRFVSYATPFIRRAMEDAIGQMTSLYRIPSDMDSPAERKRSTPLSMDAPLGGRENVNLLSVVEDTSSPIPGEDQETADLHEQLQLCLPKLNDRERMVVSMIYGINTDKRTMAEIGEVMGLKRERVRQIRDKAMRKVGKLSGKAESTREAK